MIQVAKSFEGTFEVPKGYVLIKSVDLKELDKKVHAHEIWGMKELRDYTLNKSETWVKRHILKNPALRDEIQKLRDRGALKGGGYGSNWMMFADDIKEFINENKEIIMREEK